MRLLQEAVNSMPVALLIVDSNTTLHDINDKGVLWFSSILKLGDNITEKLRSDKGHIRMRNLDFIRSKNGHFQVGTYVYRYVSNSFDSEDRSYYSICVVEDTEGFQSLENARTVVDALQKTTHKSGEDSVSDPSSNEFKRKCIESAGVGLESDSEGTMILYSPQGIIVECSNGFRGYTREELIGSAAFECIHPDDIPSTAERHVGFVEQNKKMVPVLSWFRKKHKNGHYVHVEFCGALRYGENGESWVEGIERVLSTDRMDRVVSSVLDQIPSGVIMIDTKTGFIEMCNHNASNWLNIERDQNFESRLLKMKGTAFSEKECEKLISTVREFHARTLIGDDEEFTVRTEQGKVFNFIGRAQSNPSRSAASASEQSSEQAGEGRGEPASHSVLWIVNDITVLSRAMEKKTDSILQFMRCTSHDMRTPMQAISLAGYSIKEDLAKIGCVNNEVDTIIASSAVLETIVSNILEFKNISSMTMVKELSYVDVRQKIERVVAILRHSTLLYDNVKLSARFEHFSPGLRLSLDEKMLDRIVLNIVSNSLKFTPQGSVTIICSVRDTDDSDPLRQKYPLMLSITVKDTGRGMDAVAVKHLGDLGFFSGDEGGFGLGTYIVATYIKLLKGNMHVESEVGKGTSITITIPTKGVDKTMGSRTLSSGAEDCGQQEDIQTLVETHQGTILVAEDVSINRHLLVKSLTKAGYAVEEAVNGYVALNMMLEKHYRTVFMDINMPVMNGDEAVQKYWQQSTHLKHPKIIMLTGNITDADRELAQVYGAHEFLTKPIRPKKLLEAAGWSDHYPPPSPPTPVDQMDIDVGADPRKTKKARNEGTDRE